PGSGGGSVSGDDGNDVIVAPRADTGLFGGAGDDIIHFEGASGTEAVYGGDGNDTLYADASSGFYQLDGGSGIDTLILSGDFPNNFTGGSNIETVLLTPGSNYTLTTYSHWTIDGSALGAHDTLTVNSDYLNEPPLDVLAGAGDDTITGGDSGDNFSGGAGNDL